MHWGFAEPCCGCMWKLSEVCVQVVFEEHVCKDSDKHMCVCQMFEVYVISESWWILVRLTELTRPRAAGNNHMFIISKKKEKSWTDSHKLCVCVCVCVCLSVCLSVCLRVCGCKSVENFFKKCKSQRTQKQSVLLSHCCGNSFRIIPIFKATQCNFDCDPLMSYDCSASTLWFMEVPESNM